MAMEHETAPEEVAALFDDEGNINAMQAIGRFASDSSESTSTESTNTESGVTRGQCARWRRSIRHPSVTLTSLGKRAGVEPSTVRYHIRDGCTHRVDEPRVTESQQ